MENCQSFASRGPCPERNTSSVAGAALKPMGKMQAIPHRISQCLGLEVQFIRGTLGVSAPFDQSRHSLAYNRGESGKVQSAGPAVRSQTDMGTRPRLSQA
jgi:hypothetical protein